MLLPSAEAPAVYSDKNLLAIVKKKRERTVYDGKRALFFSQFPSHRPLCAFSSPQVPYDTKWPFVEERVFMQKLP